jgi:uncharacterized membrane protein HdeD (DUF308 family)
MESSLDRSKELVRSQASKWRWAIGLHGLVSVAVGVMILAWPEISIYALTIVFGIYTLGTGIAQLAMAFKAEENRGWLVLSGLLGIVVGIVVLAWPGMSAVALLYVIGVYAVLLGITAIVA